MMSVWFVRLARIGAVLALAVVMLGAYVRSTDAGLGCPDWPGCYGRLVVPHPATSAEELGLEYTAVADTFARTIEWAVSEGLVTRPLPRRTVKH